MKTVMSDLLLDAGIPLQDLQQAIDGAGGHLIAVGANPQP